MVVYLPTLLPSRISLFIFNCQVRDCLVTTIPTTPKLRHSTRSSTPIRFPVSSKTGNLLVDTRDFGREDVEGGKDGNRSKFGSHRLVQCDVEAESTYPGLGIGSGGWFSRNVTSVTDRDSILTSYVVRL